MIDVAALTFSYPGSSEPAVEDLSFAVQEGEVFGFLGPSGAGKSTTQNILIGLLRGWQGEASVLGRALGDWGADYYRAIGVSFELPNHYLKLTARENLEYFRALYGGVMSTAASRAAVATPNGSVTAVIGMLRTDWLRLMRDRFLLGMALYIIGLTVATRWALPWTVAEVAVRLDFDLTPYLPLIVSHCVVVLAALVGGIIGGFMLLETRESRTIRALLVTPVPISRYVAVLSLVLFVFTVLLTLIEAPIIGVALAPWPALVGAAIAGAPSAALVMLFMASLADNKVEALAYSKFVSVGALIPSASFFLPEPWQWIAGVYPQYWGAKTYWIGQAGGDSWPLCVLGGLIVSALWMMVLLRAFMKAARKQT